MQMIQNTSRHVGSSTRSYEKDRNTVQITTCNVLYIKFIVFTLYACVINPNRQYLKLRERWIHVYTGGVDLHTQKTPSFHRGVALRWARCQTNTSFQF